MNIDELANPRSVANDAMSALGVPKDWARIKSGIFAGESGGDYEALFGYSNRPGGQFAGTSLTDMTIDDALRFSDPSGPYGQWVKGQVGRVATPLGAYQIVGTTLRAAKDALGLRGDERLTPAMQDHLGMWVYENQGTGAWEGYQGPREPGDYAAPSGRPAGLLSGSSYSTKEAPMTPPEEQRGLLHGLLGPKAQKFLTPDRVARTQMALEGMTLNPNQGVVEAAKQTLGASQDRNRRNVTAEWLAKQGRTDLAEGVMNGAVDGKQAMTIYARDRSASEGGPTVGAQQILEDGTIIQSTSAGPRVFSPDGSEIIGQAAADAVRKAREYEVENQREIYGARRTGTNEAEIATGGAAAAASEQGKQSITLSGEYFKKYNSVRSGIVSIDRAIAALDAGAESGVIYNQLPDITQASGELKSAMNELGLSVVAGTTFGALSEGELRLALATAVPQNLPPEELKSWLIARRAAQEKAAQELANAATYFAQDGTIDGYIKEFGGTVAGSEPGISVETLPTAAAGVPQGVDPDLWKHLTPEERRLWK